MQRAHCRHLPVVSDGRLAGIISLRDLLQIELDEKREELEFLHAYMGQ
jgi:CBS domain-containing protein